MSKKIIGLFVAALTLLFSFQNCQKSASNLDEINSQNLTSSAASSSSDLSQQSLESLDVYVPSTTTITKASNTYQVNYNLILKIDLRTGVLTETSDMDSATSKYCLTDDLLNELNSILTSSNVCKTQPNIPDGFVCGQALRPPYAQVFTSQSQFDLGSATDSCGHNSVDLCGDQSDLLKGAIENIKKQYKQMTCP